MSMGCPRCAYELTVVNDGVCPECGLAFRVVDAAKSDDAKHRLGLLGGVGFASSLLAVVVVYVDAETAASALSSVGPIVGDLTQWKWYMRLTIMGGVIGLLGFFGLIGSSGLMWVAWGSKRTSRLSRWDRRAYVATLLAVVVSAIGAALWHATSHS